MKGWLLDENIPRNVTFTPALPVSHARDLGASASDTTIWQHARNNELAIVSKDADFSHRMMIATPPPWVVHLPLAICAALIFTRYWPASGRKSRRCCRNTSW